MRAPDAAALLKLKAKLHGAFAVGAGRPAFNGAKKQLDWGPHDSRP